MLSSSFTGCSSHAYIHAYRIACKQTLFRAFSLTKTGGGIPITVRSPFLFNSKNPSLPNFFQFGMQSLINCLTVCYGNTVTVLKGMSSLSGASKKNFEAPSRCVDLTRTTVYYTVCSLSLEFAFIVTVLTVCWTVQTVVKRL